MPWAALGEWKSKTERGERKKGKDRDGNKMKERSQRGEHRVIKGQTRGGKGAWRERAQREKWISPEDQWCERVEVHCDVSTSSIRGRPQAHPAFPPAPRSSYLTWKLI